MTDAEIRDAVKQELKLTTAGWRKPNGQPNYPGGTAPPSSHWGKAMNLLEQIGAAPPPPPPPPGNSIPADGIIRAGGVYGGAFSQQITIQTQQPVRLSANLTYTGGTIIKTQASNPPDLTLDHCTISGGSGRIIDADNFKRIVMLNNTIEKTAGITIVGNGDLTMLRNRHHNIQRVPGGVGNFFQLRHAQAGTFDIGWNEIVNEYGLSDPEDVFSIYHSSGVYAHDNMIWGQFHPGNGTGSSQNTITLDSYGTGGGLPTNNNRIENNIVVKALSIAVFPRDQPANGNQFLGNRVVSSGLLTDNVTQNRYGNAGMHVIAGGQNNHAHGNVLGYMRGSSQGGGRGPDGLFEGTPEGDAGEWQNNTHLKPGQNITPADEQVEWDRWIAKLSAAGVSIGA